MGLEFLAAFIPVLSDGVRALIVRFTGGAGAAPANVNEAVRLMEADIQRLNALAALDSAGNVSQWVANVRALQRPFAVAAVVGGLLVAVAAGSDGGISAMMPYAEMVTFYLFGDRTLYYMRKRAG